MDPNFFLIGKYDATNDRARHAMMRLFLPFLFFAVQLENTYSCSSGSDNPRKYGGHQRCGGRECRRVGDAYYK